MNGQLEAKGLEMSSMSPDFLIATHVGKNQRINVTDWGYGYGPYGRYRGYSGVDVWEYEEGTLLIDISEGMEKKLVWRGSGKRRVDENASPEKTTAIVNQTVQEILDQFPPKGLSGSPP